MVARHLTFITFCFIFGVAGFFLNGYVIQTMYNWFIPPVTGLNNISFWYACGIFALFAYFHNKSRSNPVNREWSKRKLEEALKYGGKELREQYAILLGEAIFAPLFALFFGWWIHCYC